MRTHLLDSARHNCQTAGHESVWFDWRRDDWSEASRAVCVAGGPIDAPDYLPAGASTAVVPGMENTSWKLVVWGITPRVAKEGA